MQGSYRLLLPSESPRPSQIYLSAPLPPYVSHALSLEPEQTLDFDWPASQRDFVFGFSLVRTLTQIFTWPPRASIAALEYKGKTKDQLAKQ